MENPGPQGLKVIYTQVTLSRVIRLLPGVAERIGKGGKAKDKISTSLIEKQSSLAAPSAQSPTTVQNKRAKIIGVRLDNIICRKCRELYFIIWL